MARLLGLVEARVKRFELTASGKTVAAANASALPGAVRQVIENQPAFRVGKRVLDEDPGASATVIGIALARELRAEWTESTATWMGKNLRNWMRAAGLRVVKRSVLRASKRVSAGKIASQRHV